MDEIIQQLRPQLATVPGIRVFLQNLPPIRIGGMLTKSLYQFTLQSPDIKELYQLCPPAGGQDARPCRGCRT